MDKRSMELAAMSIEGEKKDGGGSDLVDTAGLCKWFRVNRRTIYHWKATGRLPCSIKIGHHTLWRTEDIRQMIDDEFKAQAGAGA